MPDENRAFSKPTSLFPFSIFSPNGKITDLGVCWNSIFIFLGLFKYYSLMSQVVKSNYIFFLYIMFCFSRIELPIFFIYLVFLLPVMNSLQILQHTWKALLKHFWHSIRQATQQSHFCDILWQDGASCDSPSFFCHCPRWLFSWPGTAFSPLLQGLPSVPLQC